MAGTNSILLVDDDALIQQVYQRALVQHGFAVQTAQDGLAGVALLRQTTPDLVVLDLLMPKFSGVDVLKFMRGDPSLKPVPVILLSNSYMGEFAQEAEKLGVQRALMKARCTPRALVEAIEAVLSGAGTTTEATIPVSVPTAPSASPAPPPAPSGIPPAASPLPSGKAPPSPAAPEADEQEFAGRARDDFLAGAEENRAALRQLYSAFQGGNEADRGLRLQNLYRKVHFIASSAGFARSQPTALMASVFEALLFEVVQQPKLLSASVAHTIEGGVGFLERLLLQARLAGGDEVVGGRVLVVDDDAMACRLAATALRAAKLEAQTSQDPVRALEMARERSYALVLLDIEMPGMDGFEFFRRLRLTPGCERIPVIYITSYSNFESRVRTAKAGGTDFISKPILPLELAVKAVQHLLRVQLRLDESAAAPA